jgi:hypothetical protein
MQRNKNIRVRGVRRSEPDVRKLSRALIALAQAQAEAEAETAQRALQTEGSGIDPRSQPAAPETEPDHA